MSGPGTAAVVRQLLSAPRAGRRRLVALAGAPASGKSPLAGRLAQALCSAGCQAQVVPMDGFHLHNPLLVARGLLGRKGAPETFDVEGLLSLVARLHDAQEAFFPTFERDRDIAIAGSGVIGPECDTVIVEGNYLLHDAPKWRDLAAHWDFSIRLSTPIETLRQRLVDRWLAHGLSPQEAQARAEENDLPNARLVESTTLAADLTL